jgi:hypothetical protein
MAMFLPRYAACFPAPTALRFIPAVRCRLDQARSAEVAMTGWGYGDTCENPVIAYPWQISGLRRLPRIVLPGVPRHVTERGNRGERTFFEDCDYAL